MRDRFREAGLDTPELDARLLAQHAFGIDAMALIRREREPLAEGWIVELERATLRRLAGEPVSRIIGQREFWGLKLTLNPSTLDPRPETELLVGEAISFAERHPAPRIIDLGTGSGAIAIAIADAVSKARLVATDISGEALQQARMNAQHHKVADRIEFLTGPWWQAVPDAERFDLIVSNPPYIASDVIPKLQPEVRLFDPKAALDGGFDGLDAYRAIVAQALRRLNKGGQLLLEIGSNQGETVSRIVARAGLSRIEVQKDLNGLDRLVSASHS